MKQLLHAFKLKHEDGSESKWTFVGDPEEHFKMLISLSNYSRYKFEGTADDIYRWALPRELVVYIAIFEFNPDTMTFRTMAEPREMELLE